MAHFNETVDKVIDAIELTPSDGNVMDVLVEAAYSLGYGMMTEDKKDMVWLMVDDALTVSREDGGHEVLDKMLPTLVDIAPEKFIWCETDVEGYEVLLMCDDTDGKTHGYFTDKRFIGRACKVERPDKVDYNFDRFVEAARWNARSVLPKTRRCSCIGRLVVDAIDELAEKRLWSLPCAKGLDKFEPGTEVYVLHGYDAIDLMDWNDFWACYPDWYEKVYMLSDNGEYTAEQVGDMTLEEVDARYNTCAGEDVFYTVI